MAHFWAQKVLQSLWLCDHSGEEAEELHPLQLWVGGKGMTGREHKQQAHAGSGMWGCECLPRAAGAWDEEKTACPLENAAPICD